ncbi:competence type IV pilus minor pilin ComGE [Thermaerobacillus caldiproteolyticus]|uniref:Competence protein ComGE n=1 Tax=Thermaerobacillus caldiproteolyticus TaxID=247480 RepID=A0A7W0BWZ5_9BACL|nr:competence type IV pilus minor pilin ComGE [Anoxybacillus caldiproteolyticus]MBA2873458.1 competence protein ComGE [Anoxybacillus caldiproteolyticus]QPA30043.1 type II secretion system protein [Anoxybacillus caldiproteolyticus]
MSKKCSGFTFIEALVSLALLLFVTAFLLPSFTHIMIERENTVLKSRAQQLLQAALREQEDEEQGEKTVTDGRITYVIQWNSEEEGMRKACVHWQDYVGRNMERCGYAKR